MGDDKMDIDAGALDTALAALNFDEPEETFYKNWTPEEWKELTKKHPLALLMPRLSENLTPLQLEIKSMFNLQHLASKTDDPKKILQMLRLRLTILQDADRYNWTAARGFLCELLIHEKHMTAAEKDIAFSTHFRKPAAKPATGKPPPKYAVKPDPDKPPPPSRAGKR